MVREAPNAPPPAPAPALQGADIQRPYAPSFGPMPTTIWGRIFFVIRELARLSAHIFWFILLGPYYDLPPEERVARVRDQALRREKFSSVREVKTVLLGYLYNEYELRWRRDNGTVLLCADSDNDSEVSVAAYDFLGEEGRRQLRLVRYNGIDPDLNHPSFEFLPYGSVSAFISSTSAWPFLSHPSIPSPASQIALPLHWLLNLSSALAFLHDRNITHRSLSLDLLWLRADFSLALFDFSCAAFAREGEETAVETELKMIGCLQFPLDEIDIAYYSAEDALALGRAMDVFYYGTVAWRMLTRTLDGPVGWHLPVQEDGERDWSLTELRKRLADAVESSGPYEPAGMEVARKCWRLEYRDGCEVRRALEKVVEGIGLSVAGDAVEGVAEAVDGFKRTYRPETFLGNGYSGGEYPGSLSSSLFS